MSTRSSNRTEKTGVVVSDAMQKTRVVSVETLTRHAFYQKKLRTRRKYVAHDEQNVSKRGDVVRIQQTRPLSATKRWRIVAIVREGSAAAQRQELEHDTTQIDTNRG